MLHQNSIGMKPVIAKVGCFFKSCVTLAEFATGKYLTAQEHNDLWDKSVLNGWILNDNILKSAPIIQAAFLLCGQNVKVSEIGTSLGMYKGCSQLSKDGAIEKIKQGGPSKTHFRVVSIDNKVLFDPHDPEIKSLGSVYTIYYHYKKI